MCILENNGMPGLTTPNSWNLTRSFDRDCSFSFFFLFSGYGKVLRLRLDQGEPL